MSQPDQKSKPELLPWTLIASLSVLCLIVRQAGLMSLPIFGDEAIYLRWAQLIGEGHGWVSLHDPKPPLHFWMLAAVFHLTQDPLRAARLVSVVAGVLSIPAVMLTCAELGRLVRRDSPAGPSAMPPPSGRAIGVLASILMIFCPFLAFYQRLATAESLFILEMLAVVWLSLRWARLVAAGESNWKTAIALGVAFAATMMTRQGLSYVLWAMPVAALACAATKSNCLQLARRSAGPFLLALGVALILWSPFLLAELNTFAGDNGGTVLELKRRIFYQGGFTAGENRLLAAAENLHRTFIPSVKNGVPETGWLFYYLTPGVFVATLLGVLYLALRRQWRLLFFLAAWIALMLLLPNVLLSTLYSRYVLAGVVPLLVAAAYLLADALAWIFSRRAPAVLLWTGAAVVLGGLLVAPVLQLGTQSSHWDRQLLTNRDRYQYLTGWTAGGPTRDAIAALQHEAALGPVVIITDEGWGTPADAVWAYLSRRPNLTVYYTPHDNQGVILSPVDPANPTAYRLRSNKWLYTPPEAVHLSPEARIFYITNDPVHAANDLPAIHYFSAANPNLGDAATFEGIEGGERVVVFPLIVPAVTTRERPQE